jgi:hypothetical protein
MVRLGKWGRTNLSVSLIAVFAPHANNSRAQSVYPLPHEIISAVRPLCVLSRPPAASRQQWVHSFRNKQRSRGEEHMREQGSNDYD